MEALHFKWAHVESVKGINVYRSMVPPVCLFMLNLCSFSLIFVYDVKYCQLSLCSVSLDQFTYKLDQSLNAFTLVGKLHLQICIS